MNPKIELLIRIVMIIILIALNILIISNGLKLDCSKCVIMFTQDEGFNKLTTNFSIMDLYESYLNNTCIMNNFE